jgi:lipoyl(octanoyl) transferase
MELHVLPSRTGSAAENMATDLLLLQRYPGVPAPRVRHYVWRRPAFTFGYSQKIGFVRSQLPTGETFDLCRRPTGGGVVDHRDDWTYTVVIPRGHPLEELRATQSYRTIHDALAHALRAQGIAAVTKQTAEPSDAAPHPGGVCFQRAEVYDVVHADTAAKIAGAAQKRNKHGLLFQGSLWKPAATGAAIDWDRFGSDFVSALGAALGNEPVTTAWPELNDEELSALTDQYSSVEWIENR